MRTKFIAGNWKLNPVDGQQARDLCRQLKARLAPFSKTMIAVCPPFVGLGMVNEAFRDTNIAVGAQNLYWEETGAFTGEISAPMIKSAGCTYVIIGHSERRQYFGETNETVRLRTQAALKADLLPIVCVGETLNERESGVLKEVVSEQIREGLRGFSEAEISKVVVAYEPVWAIGTGKTASPAQAQEMHQYIRELLAEVFSQSIADKMLILYGGSVKPENATDLLSQADIDGALVGGASLKADSFAGIVSSAEELI
ncbi:triose-phosphate isomerase [candidate division LCP-89 bacterium B3_LCP]|uniref:Triosephosphate isomerase n=1 Tax=candidate division LCP-89 bacterium B3_LCP TaxID=2012998 RepID=A0A532V3T4_UNCL8|nr:MAG: triose-phosphate isomerase [candidate division LCP-89 bacterium B3_LCP]